MTFLNSLWRPRTLLLVLINSIIAYQLLSKFYWNKPTPSRSKLKASALPYRDYVLEDLAKFDGIQEPNILIALDMRVFDVTRAANLYGPGTLKYRGSFN